ncbi:MAG TPA: DUF420 domain-containing protein [Candidatus Sumerlaeota bacterium]|nr:DUF420 domain-containing protein [Candidatus Sumerlaeota bacterium]HOR26670.1 DUF420 domain-containing protein [Candidatus Sumerlaeota bacterium]HPK03790.1 DUF420 domain-containing protein [Candidatus Sumerlaeota bacterium]
MAFDPAVLPPINAALNATAGLLLLAGWAAWRRRRLHLHARLMVSAFAVSTLFLISYLTYHASAGHTTFPDLGWIRGVYLLILATHVILAAVVAPLAVAALVLALRGRFARHRRLTRWLLPLWLYVSVTGVIIYFMLYHWFAAAGRPIP